MFDSVRIDLGYLFGSVCAGLERQSSFVIVGGDSYGPETAIGIAFSLETAVSGASDCELLTSQLRLACFVAFKAKFSALQPVWAH